MSGASEEPAGWGPGPKAYRLAGAFSGCAAGVSLAVSETLKALRTVQTSKNIWEELPLDLLLEIFRHAELDQPTAARDRCRASMVCRKWHVALQAPEFWQDVTLDMSEFSSPEAVSCALQGLARRATQPDCTLRIIRSQPDRPSMAQHDSTAHSAAAAAEPQACDVCSQQQPPAPASETQGAVKPADAMSLDTTPAAVCDLSVPQTEPPGQSTVAAPAPAGAPAPQQKRQQPIHLCGGEAEVHPALTLTQYYHSGAVKSLLRDYLDAQQGVQLWPTSMHVQLPWRVKAQQRQIEECSRLLHSITSHDVDPVISALSLLSLFK